MAASVICSPVAWMLRCAQHDRHGQRWSLAATAPRPKAADHLGLIGIGLVLGLAFLAGCSAMPEAGATRLARLVVHNLTDYEWRVTVTPAGGGIPVVTNLAARQTVALTLAGGDYRLEQRAMKTGADLQRHVPVTVAAGQTYDWPLVTLLSDPEVRGTATVAGGTP